MQMAAIPTNISILNKGNVQEWKIFFIHLLTYGCILFHSVVYGFSKLCAADSRPEKLRSRLCFHSHKSSRTDQLAELRSNNTFCWRLFYDHMDDWKLLVVKKVINWQLHGSAVLYDTVFLCESVTLTFSIICTRVCKHKCKMQMCMPLNKCSTILMNRLTVDDKEGEAGSL